MIKTILHTSATVLFLFFTVTSYAENTNFTTTHFSGSGNCSSCHDGLTDTAGDDVSIVKDWGASMMANATKDPFWQAKVATELERNPNLSSVINDKCTQCHAPMANYEITKVQNEEVTLFGPGGILDPGHALHDAAMNGVSCTACHQIEDDATLGTLEGFSGNYRINASKTLYGQYSNITGQPMINSTGYTPAYSAHISDSAMCATCHNLKTPYVDAQGNVLTTTPDSEFPEQMPYTEWQNSIFDDAGSNPQSCQDCHMPKTRAVVSARPNGLAAKDDFSKHHLVGANTTMLTLLRDNATQLDVTSTNMDSAINRARAMLQSSVSINIDSVSVNNGVLEAEVGLSNNSGHKTPTGYPSRRMWLNFKVTDSNNNIVFESGRINTDGSIVGADNDSDPTIFEPHYDLITSADQVQIYEPVMADSDGQVTYTLLRGAQYLKDNRLTPQGFNKLSVPSDVAVRGLAFNDDNFNQGSDEITYRFPVAVSGELTVSVSLNYQTIGYGFLQDLYQDSQLLQVQTFKTMFDAQSLKHEQIASAQTTVVSDGGSNPPPVSVTNLSASSSTIEEGHSVTLSWSSTDANSCSASWTNSTATSGSQSLSPTVTTTYSISCNDDSGSTNDSLTVTVNPSSDTEPDDTEPSTPPTASDESTVVDSSTSTSSSGNLGISWITAGLFLIVLMTRARVRTS